MDKKSPCPKGERRNRKTGLCEKMDEEVLKYKQWQRNKKKGIVMDEEGNILKPPTPDWKRTKKAEKPVKKRATKKKSPADVPDVPAADVPDADVPDADVPDDFEEQGGVNVLEEGANVAEEAEDISTIKEDLVERIELQPIEPPVDVEEKVAGVEMMDRLYPTLDDPEFAYKIKQRQEFADTKYDGEIHNIREQADKLCKTPFELMPHQLFVRNFLSFGTPYNSLLLYHGLGSGKTCSAIGIAEEMRAYMKQMGITKRIIIVASPNVQDNFRLQLFDERRLEQLPDGTWNLNTCIGNALLQEINPTNLRGLTRERIIAQIRSLINQSYVFMGNKGEFANYIQKAIHVPTDAGYTEKERAVLIDRKIKAHFNNRLVVIDEIHNIRISDSNKMKLTTVLLNKIARRSDNMRLLLLSATPMYNSYQEIIWLTNLLNANDNRPEITVEDVFNPDGTFIETKGKELLLKKLTGYVSYVRGENPYIFPSRIYPETFDPDNVLGPSPSKQMNQIEIKEPLKFIPVYKNGIGAYQSLGYDFILRNLGLASNIQVDKHGRERAMPTFENMEQFGYTLLMEPLESLIMVYPNPKLDKRLSDKRGTEKDNKDIIKGMIGKQGLSNVMKFSRSEKPVPRRYDYEYKPAILEKYREIFSPEEIPKYSAKISNICDILRKPSRGIVLIYSQYIDGGLVPMALALESMGFSRYASTPEHSRGLLKNKKESIDAITMLPKKKGAKENMDFKPARYVMITGEKDFSQNNNEDIKYVTNKENANGENVKVILISMAASEGLDFKNIRQIHILEPWYNMNRVEQIIGRGVRNLSHCNLLFEERNVEIYLHGTVLDKDEEAADVYVYRSAEKKAIQIGRVTRVLKEISVDCLLNLAQTNFTETKLLENAANTDIRIHLSSRGDEWIPFRVGDKPRTEACDYMENCELTCAAKDLREEVIKDTYDEGFLKTNSIIIMKKIRDLYREKMVYSWKHLKAAINQVKKYPIEHIYYALTRFIKHKTEGLVDKYGRSGYLVNKGDYYVFQPAEIMDEAISMFERSTPVDYKPVSLRMEVPKEIRPMNVVDEEIEGIESLDTMEQEEAPLAKKGKAAAVIESDRVRTYEEMIEEIRGINVLLSSPQKEVVALQKDWYKYVLKVKEELKKTHEMKSGWIQKYAVFHYLDKLSLPEKLVLVSNVPKGVEEGIELLVKLYFDERVIKAEEDGEQQEAILLANGSKNQLFIKEAEGAERWRESTYTDEQLFASAREQRFVVPKESIHRTEVGFMHPFKEKEVVFKMKDLTQKRNNTGAKCTDASKQAIASKIGVVIGKPTQYTATQLEKPELCVILEILMRMKTVSTGVYYFFGPEMANEMKLTTLHW